MASSMRSRIETLVSDVRLIRRAAADAGEPVTRAGLNELANDLITLVRALVRDERSKGSIH